ncbi:geraniol 8-hydroxylase-like [Cucumis melo var. makuwa]|uniref:Geraniol 8-hydroxylase-like n=3 Tax=Cucumis melo TaxID=3656 RepID=A0A5D3D639_CUCMM|nr:geraniol 8-hydroxylase-like [Cucumis melo]KAA0037925.1 geraniol 8-hydroxylase-like [Cucumis melo var. makuwa]TYK19002.1 geraniol 8-hydroxylase-like [Cucumis melo var. makuwa]
MEFWTFILFLSVVFFISRLKSKSTSSSNKLPPGPNPLPLIGNLLDLGDKPHKSLATMAKVHGQIISLKLGRVTAVVISSSAMAKEVLQTNDQFLCNRTVPDALTAHSHHELGFPWIPVSSLWRNYRKICNNMLFAGKILDMNENLRRKKVEELVEIVRKSALKGEAVDLGRLVFTTTLNLLSNTILSVDLADPSSELAKEFKKYVWGIMEEAGKPNLSDYFPMLRKFDIQGMRKRMEIHMRNVLNILDSMIKQRMKQQELNPDSVPKNDLLHCLLKNDTDTKIDGNQMIHLLLVLFVAGSDTTSSTLQWAMAELLRNPDKLAKAQAEIRKLVLEKNRIVEEADIPRLPYLQAVVKETFRLHPVVPLLLPRKAQQEVEIASFTIPKDAQIMINIWAMGRDPTKWENPECFEPERFLGSEIDVRGRSFELIPFGGGRRICPGIPLAMRMMHLILGSLISFFDWKVEDGFEVNMEDKFGITVEMAHPLRAIPSLI